MNDQRQSADTSVWAQPWEEVADALGVDPEQGLDRADVDERIEEFGPNELRRHEARSAWAILWEQLKSLIILLLVAAAAAAFATGEVLEGWAVVVVIVLNAAIGFFTELRAVRAMEALSELSRDESDVRRNGSREAVAAEEVVPGDIVLVDEGDVVTADLRLVEANGLETDESALTGESVPVSKTPEPADGDASVAERSSMLFKGTSITRGSGAGIAVATGMDTELGHISELVEEAEEEVTPLQERLDRLGHKLLWLTLGIAVVVVVSGVLGGRELELMIKTGVALAVAAIPEGLPIVATVALAYGVRQMARRHALINRLSSVETLGSATVIFTDKTGTLTENEMTVAHLALDSSDVTVEDEELRLDGETADPDENSLLRAALEIGLLCNHASLDGGDAPSGDPMEVALLAAAHQGGLDRDEILEEQPEVREEAFSPETKKMATFHETDEGIRVAVKGAPEAVLEACPWVMAAEGDKELDAEQAEGWRRRNEELASKGFRVLALATKTVDSKDADPYEDLSLVGLVGFIDPPREDVREAVGRCRSAGIHVVMVTGDHPLTARGIARDVGLVEEDDAEVVRGSDLEASKDPSDEERERMLRAAIFARVDPKQKLNLIDVNQEAGRIVAMTGDGVNDAPALKKADIGIAMGRRGTEAAREAADMVLEDDAFATIVRTVELGRIIFANIRRFVYFLLSCNTSEVLVVGLATVAGAPLPILPLQILFLNLVTDVFPALALGVGRGEAHVMKHPPRDPQSPILNRRHWLGIAIYGAIFTASVLGVMAVALTALGLKAEQAVTLTFLTLAFSQLWHVFNMRSPESSILRNEITGNRYIWGALAICVGLVLAAVYLPGLSDVLSVQPPGFTGWMLVLGGSLVPLIIGQTVFALAPKGVADYFSPSAPAGREERHS